MLFSVGSSGETCVRHPPGTIATLNSIKGVPIRHMMSEWIARLKDEKSESRKDGIGVVRSRETRRDVTSAGRIRPVALG